MSQFKNNLGGNVEGSHIILRQQCFVGSFLPTLKYIEKNHDIMTKIVYFLFRDFMGLVVYDHIIMKFTKLQTSLMI